MPEVPHNDNRTYTIWSNARKFEWLVRDGEQISARSGLIFNSRNVALSALKKVLAEADSARD